MPKSITIDQLAMMIQKSFADIYRRLDNIDGRLDGVEGTMATKEDLKDLEERLNFRWSNEFDRLRDDMKLVKTKLNLL